MSSDWPPNVRPLLVASAAVEDVGTDTPTDPGTIAELSAEVHRCQLRITLRLAAAEHGRLLHVPGLGWHFWDGFAAGPPTPAIASPNRP
ncbi:MAG TPA: hypothetical protein VIJ15_00200 [Dermatophilaceae bacterium]